VAFLSRLTNRGTVYSELVFEAIMTTVNTHIPARRSIPRVMIAIAGAVTAATTAVAVTASLKLLGLGRGYSEAITEKNR